MNEIYEEYKREHPEELTNIERLKNTSLYIEEIRRRRVEAKKKKIEECRRYLDGEYSVRRN